MAPLITAQFMAATVLGTVALLHLLIWSRKGDALVHLSFAVTALAAGGNAIAEAGVYRAATPEAMATALKWYVGMSGVWLLGLTWFVVAYCLAGTITRRLAWGVAALIPVALVINSIQPGSLLYAGIPTVRTVDLPWGEPFYLARGGGNPWRLVADIVQLALFALVIVASFAMWKQGRRLRAWFFGVSVTTFLIVFGIHATLIDREVLDSPYLSTYGFLVVVLLMSYDLSSDVVQASQLSQELIRKDAMLRTAVADERSRIAGDLHDSVTQTLFSIAAIADALPAVAERHPEQARQGLQELKQLTRGTLAEMRTLLLELRPAALMEKGLGDLLTQLADAMAARSHILIAVRAECIRPLPDDVHIGLYRIAQEALNNVIKHSHATEASLILDTRGEDVGLAIEDNGSGFEADAAMPGLGLVIMRERAEAIGGVLKMESTLEAGTTIRVTWSDPKGGKVS